MEGQGSVLRYGAGVADGCVANQKKKSLVGEKEHLILFIEKGVNIACGTDLLGIWFFFNLFLQLQANYSAFLCLFLLHYKTYHIIPKHND